MLTESANQVCYKLATSRECYGAFATYKDFVGLIISCLFGCTMHTRVKVRDTIKVV